MAAEISVDYVMDKLRAKFAVIRGIEYPNFIRIYYEPELRKEQGQSGKIPLNESATQTRLKVCGVICHRRGNDPQHGAYLDISKVDPFVEASA